MGLITYIQGYSAIIAVVLMPFLVKSRVPAYWVLYLLFCTILTPFIGYPLSVSSRGRVQSFALRLSVTIFALLISNV